MLYNKSKNRVWFAGGSVNLITSQMNYLNNINNSMIEMDQGHRFIRTGHLPNCMMITREVQEKVGYFDESYYIMFEEADYAARVSRAGGGRNQIVVCNDAITYHDCLLPEEACDELRKLGCETPVRTFHFAKNRNIYIKKYAPWYGKLIYFMLFRYIFALYYFRVALKNHRRDIAKAYLYGMFYRQIKRPCKYRKL